MQIFLNSYFIGANFSSCHKLKIRTTTQRDREAFKRTEGDTEMYATLVIIILQAEK